MDIAAETTEQKEYKGIRVHFVRTKCFEKAFDDLKCYVDTLELSNTKSNFLNHLIDEALKEAERSGFKQGLETAKDNVLIEFT